MIRIATLPLLLPTGKAQTMPWFQHSLVCLVLDTHTTSLHAMVSDPPLEIEHRFYSHTQTIFSDSPDKPLVEYRPHVSDDSEQFEPYEQPAKDVGEAANPEYVDVADSPSPVHARKSPKKANLPSGPLTPPEGSGERKRVVKLHNPATSSTPNLRPRPEYGQPRKRSLNRRPQQQSQQVRQNSDRERPVGRHRRRKNRNEI